MNTTTEKLHSMKQNGFSLDFGDTLNLSFESYKKTAIMAGVVFLLFMIVLLFFYAGILAFMYGVSGFGDMASPGWQTKVNMSPLAIFGQFVISTLMAGIIAPLSAGFYKMNHNALTNEEVSISNAFEYYQSKYFKDIFISAVFIASFLFAIQTAMQYLLIGDMTKFAKNPQNYLGSLTSIIFITYFSIILVYLFTVLSTPFIIFGDLSATQAISKSIWVVFKKFWVVLLLLFIAIVIACMGFIAICIGFIFTAPFVYSAVYSIYANAVGIETISEIDQIGITDN